MNPVSAAVLAAANIDKALVYKKPQIALFSNGNELRDPGSALAPGNIINSNHYALSSLINMWGGQAHYIGCAPDDLDAVKHMFSAPHTADIIVPIGGASVGDYDYVKAALRAAGGEILFEKIAVRPGKPTWHGRLGAQLILGLPGNPASAIVTACLFLKPLIAHMSGAANIAASRQALTQTALAENGPRETYLRANLTYGPDARLYVQPAKKQDSSLLRPFLQGQVLIKRAPNARACAAGERVDIVDMF